MTRRGLAGLVGVGHRPGTAAEERFLPTLAAWFCAPFLGLPAGPTAALAAPGAGPAPGTPTARPRALGPVVRALARLDDLAADGADGSPVTLVDRHHAGPYGTLGPGDLAATAATVAADRPASVALRFDDGTVVATSPSDLVALLVTQLLVGPVPAAVGDGLVGLLGRFRPGPGPVRRPGLAVLLPFPAGRAERTATVAAPAVAVAVGAYPVVGALVPEVAAVTVPVVGRGTPFPTTDPATGVVVPAGARGRVGLRLTPFTRTPVRTTQTVGRRAAAGTLRQVKHALRRPAPAGVLGRIGIDVDARRGIVTRLDVPLPSNPWLTRAEWRFLDPGSPVDVTVGVGGGS